MTAVAQAFVPGHVTGFFVPHPDQNPTEAGSQGAGVALSDGVTVTVRPADEVQIALNGEEIEMEAVTRVLETLQRPAMVRAVTDLPLGSGFGVSGGMALGTALAANEAFDRRLSMNELVTISHGAEVQAETGLGDVVAQATGGMPIRLEPGGPHHNMLDAIPAYGRIEYLSLGTLPTDAVLSKNTEAIETAGKQALSTVVREPTVESFMRASRRFSRESNLLSADVRAVIREVTEAGGRGAMAMLGETVFTIGSGLTDAGYDAQVCQIHQAGAMIQPPPTL